MRHVPCSLLLLENVVYAVRTQWGSRVFNWGVGVQEKGSNDRTINQLL